MAGLEGDPRPQARGSFNVGAGDWIGRTADFLLAAIPDMDTLALAPAPEDSDWAPLRKLCVPGGGKLLLPDRPLKVNRSGFTLA